MDYYSTNNPPSHKTTEGKKNYLVDFRTALLQGLADDGGLYMPRELGKFQIPNSQFQNFNEVLTKFIDIPKKNLKQIVDDAFNFPVPLVQLEENLYILELFHGPTLSFKDFGARFMARIINYYLAKSGDRLNIIVATSGDTGSAVASGFYGLPNIKVFVLYPSKRISDLQEKQLATLGKNIVALEVGGDFDDCQRLAKQVLADQSLRKKMSLSSANSINIGRLLPQMYYYFAGYSQLESGIKNPRPRTSSVRSGQELRMNFVVPSGNFGNLTAGLFAKKLGLPIKKFIAAVNRNSVIPEYLKTGKFQSRKTAMTYSSAMDVGLPSNWARVRALYDHDNDCGDDKIRKNILKDIEAIAVNEAETKKTISGIYRKYNYIADPHTAVGLAAAFQYGYSSTSSELPKQPSVVLATAHPAKFPEVVESVINKKITPPPQLVEARQKTKQSVVISKNYKDLHQLLITNY